jgi:hypothetical protein
MTTDAMGGGGGLWSGAWRCLSTGLNRSNDEVRLGEEGVLRCCTRWAYPVSGVCCCCCATASCLRCRLAEKNHGKLVMGLVMHGFYGCSVCGSCRLQEAIRCSPIQRHTSCFADVGQYSCVMCRQGWSQSVNCSSSSALGKERGLSGMHMT